MSTIVYIIMMLLCYSIPTFYEFYYYYFSQPETIMEFVVGNRKHRLPPAPALPTCALHGDPRLSACRPSALLISSSIHLTVHPRLLSQSFNILPSGDTAHTSPSAASDDGVFRALKVVRARLCMSNGTRRGCLFRIPPPDTSAV